MMLDELARKFVRASVRYADEHGIERDSDWLFFY
jgi:hypothetical protein